MRTERFAFTVAGTGQYALMQQIEHNELPAVVTHITEENWTFPKTEVEGVYARVNNGVIKSLTCKELAVLGGDGHDWQPYTSLYDKNHHVACYRCGTVKDTGVPVSDQERAEGLAELETARALAAIYSD